MFRLDMRRVPTQEEGLRVLRIAPGSADANLWRGPYSVRDIPLDPWGMPYQYYAPAPDGIHEFGVCCLGSDKALGGEGTAKDINSWQDE